MNVGIQTPQLNLIAAWIGILLGFGSGLVLGLFFQRENWLGGYTSLKRRLYRLAHISFFGLGAVNLLFYFTALHLSPGTRALAIAGWTFIIGSISMPICCLLMAHFPRTQPLFAIPVLSLILGAVLTLAALIPVARDTNSQIPTTAASLPITFHVLRFTHHASRITFHVPRSTFHVSLIPI